MRAGPARAVSVIALVVMAVLALATLRSWNSYHRLQQSVQANASLEQSVTDAAQIVAALRNTTASALAASHGNAHLAAGYAVQRQILLDSLDRLRNELGFDSILADRAALLDRQTQALIQSLDALGSPITRAGRPHHSSQLSASAIRDAAETAEANADALRRAAQSQLAVSDAGVSPAALAESRHSMEALAVLFGLTLIASFSLLAGSSAPAISGADRNRPMQLSSAIVRSSPQMILTCDMAGNVRSLNPTAEALLCDSESAVLARGSRLRDFLVAGEPLRLARQLDPQTQLPLKSDFTDAALAATLARQWQDTPVTQLYQVPLQFRRSDGLPFTRMTSIAPLRGSTGAIEGFFLMASSSTRKAFTEQPVPQLAARPVLIEDLRYQKQAIPNAIPNATEGSRHQKESILNAAADGIFGLDPSGATLFANPSAATLLRSTPAALASCDLHALLHNHRPGGLSACAGQCNILQALSGSELVTAQDTLFHSDGTALPIEFSASPMLENGRNVGTVFSVRDISQRDALDRLKDEFVSTVSHELRTPLTSIRGALGLLNSGLMGALSEKAAELLRIALTNTDRLMRLINDVLDLERMESGSAVPEFRRADFSELVQQAAETMRAMADAAGVQIVFEAEPCNCEVDADRMLQVFTNLFSNAIKFSKPGSSITVSLSAGDEILSIAVTDQGRGIPENKLETVFERFQQVDASDSRQKGGTGLGLAICRSILQQHGGRIWAEHNQPRGSIFRMVIPRSQVPSAQNELDAQHGAAPLPVQQSILVCDDDPIARSLVRHHLQQHGYNVLEAESGPQAIELAKKHLPDTILLDLFMPGMNGWETLHGLKAHAATAAIPVVILSVFTSRHYEREDIQKVDGWVNKPFSQYSLLTALGSAMQPGNDHQNIVLVESDNEQAALITSTFASSGLTVHRATSSQHALRLCHTIQPQLMVLNLSLPKDEGMQIVSWLRQHDELHKLPLVVYSGREVSNAELELITQGPAQFMERARVQPAEVAQLVLNMLRRQRSNVGNAAFQAKAFVPTEDSRRSRVS